MALFDHSTVIDLMQDIGIIGIGVGVVASGIWKIYKMARNVEKIFEFTVENRETNANLAKELALHTSSEEAREHSRDQQLHDMQRDIQEITREVRPNGGSSMKDQLNQIGNRLQHLEDKVL